MVPVAVLSSFSPSLCGGGGPGEGEEDGEEGEEFTPELLTAQEVHVEVEGKVTKFQNVGDGSK